MLTFISSQFLLYIAIALVLFIPGYFLILTTGLRKEFSSLEKFVLTFGSSIAIIDFLMIMIGKSPFRITGASVFGAIFLFCAICTMICFYRQKKISNIFKREAEKSSDTISKRSTLLVTLLIFLTIFIKTIYFTDTIFPTTTDLGHHMYWTKIITTTGNLPQYEKADISQQNTIEKPAPIADFIIGEHLIFAAISLLSGADFISAFPALVLFLIHIMSILAIFILTREFFKKSEHRDTIAIIALFLVGPLYALASPQAKFVSGGVIGNNIGNLFIPLMLFLYVKAFAEKKYSLLAYALFISVGLAYTHHLSMFVFIFIALFSLISFAILNYGELLSEARKWKKLFINIPVILILATAALFIFFIYTPTYLNSHAIDTAVGAPSKATRTGLTLTQLKSTAGEARFAFAFLGLILLFFASKIGKYKQAFMIGWIGALTLMSLRPDWLFVDIPSNRIASYVVFPVAIIAAYTLVSIFNLIKNHDGKNYLNPFFILLTFFTFMLFIVTGGFYDNSQTLNSVSGAKQAVQTYAASQYLVEKINDKDIVLKDHNYLVGDSWIKLFFMRGYNYPLSRGYFKRYEDGATREQCTNLMISTPNSPEAQQCFAGTKTDFIMINPQFDSAQFSRLKNFWGVYESDDVLILYKNL